MEKYIIKYELFNGLKNYVLTDESPLKVMHEIEDIQDSIGQPVMDIYYETV